MSMLPKTIAKKIVSWYSKNARSLPWRETKDPYLIWLSEIILQQTTVKQGTDYYLKFAERYPNVRQLAVAPIDDVLKLWQGLGYYSRARNLHFAAQQIMETHGGVFPNTYDEIIKLKGVGPYTAAAISSFAYDLSYPVVDGNVIRFMSRLYGIQKAVDLGPTKKEIESKAKALIQTQRPEVFNQAVMEFGALQCVPKNPNCNSCPLKKQCQANKLNIVSQIPFKLKKIKKKNRFFKFAFIVDANNHTYIQKRHEKDIWQGLYQFPLEENLEVNDALPKLKSLELEIIRTEVVVSKVYKQPLTHQNIHAQFYKIYTNKILSNQGNETYKYIDVKDLNNYAWPKIIDLYFNDLCITLF